MAQSAAPNAGPPTIIFLMSDQQRADALGCVNPLIKTPNLDELAVNGVRFDQTVCQCPMCLPSRHSLMLGLYCSQIGTRTNGEMLATDADLPLPTLAQRLQAAGYQTAGFGKTHWWVGQADPRVPDSRVEPSPRGFQVRAKARAVNSGFWEPGAVMMEAHDPAAWAAYNAEIEDWGAGEEGIAGYVGCTSRVPWQQHREGWLTERCLEWMDGGGLDDSRPLFLYLSFDAPHAGFNVPAGYEELYDIEAIPDLADPPQPIEPWGHALQEWETTPLDVIKRVHLERQAHWQKLSPLERRRTTLRYWAYCTFVDDLYGRVLRRLRRAGRLENSLIVFVSDHGDMMGERWQRFSKYCLYEGSVRVPLVLSGSAVPAEQRGQVDHRLAELVDVLPTLMAAAGLPADGRLPGLDLLGDATRAGQFCEYHGSGFEPERRAPAYMWRTHEWKLILYIPGLARDARNAADQIRGELYHLASDPFEYTNLFNESSSRAMRDALTRELLMQLALAWARFPAAE